MKQTVSFIVHIGVVSFVFEYSEYKRTKSRGCFFFPETFTELLKCFWGCITQENSRNIILSACGRWKSRKYTHTGRSQENIDLVHVGVAEEPKVSICLCSRQVGLEIIYDLKPSDRSKPRLYIGRVISEKDV